MNCFNLYNIHVFYIHTKSLKNNQYVLILWQYYFMSTNNQFYDILIFKTVKSRDCGNILMTVICNDSLYRSVHKHILIIVLLGIEEDVFLISDSFLRSVQIVV